ncbi:MAG: 3-methyl-2-oxobutanoate hydroxymethyltransferase [Verrucomicrobia bacterium]|nr:3-methyl-2-oxobutanoate hydroxymethyltransferase [Verrucomicrobiota bacterium]MDA1088405.1 3-methyl-2-oxobutanoate hydroxymethyltransferase [Verrucomicrobiota bacterium]
MSRDASYFRACKERGDHFSVLTCYDYPTACCEEEAGIEMLLVGDSLGTNVLGYESERDVTIEDMVHHTAAVSRGRREAYILSDLPFGTCDTVPDALVHANSLREAGADGVKIEGFFPEIVASLTQIGIDVCGHLGLLPQTAEVKSLKAKTVDAAIELVDDALALEAAGALFMLFELIPTQVAAEASRRLGIPTIGIGAGPATDGQVLVVPDLLGITPVEFRHNKRYAETRPSMLRAMKEYAEDVRTGRFPSTEHSRSLDDAACDALREAFGSTP